MADPSPIQLLKLARTQPQLAENTCRALLDAGPECVERLTIQLALGWACFTQGNLPAARRAVEELQAQEAAAPDGADVRIVDSPAPAIDFRVETARLESAILIECGELSHAESRLRAALEAVPAARLWSALGGVQIALGAGDRAITSFQHAIALLGPDESADLRLAVENNRATALLEGGRYREAVDALIDVRGEARSIDNDHLWALATHNLGAARARLGDMSRAVELFDLAAESLGKASDSISLAHATTDRARLLLDAGLLDEAEHSAARAFSLFSSLANRLQCWSTRKLQAQIATAAGDWSRAVRRAEEMAAELGGIDASDRHRRETTALLNSCSLARELESMDASEPTNTTLIGHGDYDLDESPADVLTDVGLLLLHAEQPALARSFLDAGARPIDADESLIRNLHTAVARAQLMRLDGDASGAARIAEAALDSVRATPLGVAELRSMIHRRARQLASIALAHHLSNGDGAAAIVAVEAERRILLQPEPKLSVPEADALAELRSVTRSLDTPRLSGEDVERLQRRRAAIENRIIALHRRAQQSMEIPGGSEAPTNGVYCCASEGVSWAIDLSSGRTEPVGPLTEIAPVVRALRLALSAGSGSTHLAGLSPLIATLQDRLAPLLNMLPHDDEAVLITERTLGELPWSLITDTPIAQLPALFLLRGSHGAPSYTAFVAGPHLAHADREVARSAAHHSGSATITGAEAKASSVIDLFGSADLVHLAAHGTIRSDRPLYSSLELADGPLTFFDLLVERVPDRVIFSACEVGRSASQSAAGLATLLLGRGASGVIASTGRVRDESAERVMVQTHEALARGDTMAQALTTAQLAVQNDDPGVALFATFGTC